MDIYRPKVISLTKRPGQSFGFYLRVEHGEQGHLIRCLDMGGQAELAGMKDGDRILRVNGTFVDAMSHSEVVELVRNTGTSVTFHILSESSYKQAKDQGINLSGSQSTLVANGVSKHAKQPKLCYLVKSSTGYGFSIRSSNDKRGLFMTEVSPGGVADRAGVKGNDRLVEVNGDSVENSSHDDVVKIINKSGDSVMFLLVDEETDKNFLNKKTKIEGRLATTKYLPHKPRTVELTKGFDGYGFVLQEEPVKQENFIKDIERGSPAEREGLKEKDRILAVNGKEVEKCSHEEVVDMIKEGGNKCCLLVVDKETDQMYQLGKVSPMLFWEENKETNSPPSYTEAINFPSLSKSSTNVQAQEEMLKPKLCKLEKTPAGFGFHLNGIEGLHGQYIKDVVKGGAADKAGLEDDDVVVEVNGVNVEQSNHNEVVSIIRNSGESLEMLVAAREVYEHLKAKEISITRLLIGETSFAQVHSANTPETSRRERPATPEEHRTSVCSTISEESIDERF
ncbi:Na(+)/H(+) exchange regulatory cofactor NHE-RF3 [Gouania willdenowi]|uniref:Na(+)/H(+) exchange regulatory cofactor NHE-RF3-like n=1 Tax=Gouania willdenowi TaxID=441366 RepID=A0A8C5GIG5_GOUWI|nr:Na(+)/H(+) exchange regulatory cofactor NHE-RF3-like [Gouania willdenowi]